MISVVALLLSSYGSLASDTDGYLNDDYLSRHDVHVPKAHGHHKEKRCPITGKILSNLYGDDDVVDHGKGKRCPITGKLLTDLN